MAQTSQTPHTDANAGPRSFYPVGFSFTRPADTTPYSAKDAVAEGTGLVQSVDLAVPFPGCGGYIESVALVNSVVGTTNAAFAVVILDETYTPANDNDASAISDAQMARAVAAVQIAATDWVEAGLNKVVVKGGLRLPFVCESTTKKLYVQVIATAAYTPAASEVFTVRIGVRAPA